MYKALLLSEGGGIISQSSVSPQMGTACLMIGIGGTGLAALRRVKKEVFQHLEPDDPDAAIPEYSKIAFLGIDTDTTDLTVSNPDISDLQADEQWSLNVPNLGALINSNQNQTDPCLKWLSNGLTLKGDQGAGGVRQAGRFCMFKRAGALRSKLSSLVTKTMAASGKPNIQVHVFAGISGGTGSGCFIDVCYILRDVLSGIENSTVCGYFFLPDTQLYRPGIQGNSPVENYNKRNGYAAFRDLDYCMSIPSSGGVFIEDYAPGFHVESRKAPVDLCHLVSATDSNGVIKADGFNYSMSVVAEYVLTYLSDVNASQNEKQNDNKGLTIEGFTINVNTALDTIKPRVGAERNYNIVGASSAELPLTHIGTYLASATYAKMKPTLGAHSSKAKCDEFAKRIGFHTAGLIKELSNGVSSAIPFNPDPERINGLNENLQNWSLVPQSLHGPIEACRTKAIGQIDANFKAQSRELENYDYNANKQVDHPTFILRLFNELVNMALNPAEGPTMAADILHGNGIHDFRAILKGIESEISAKEQNFRANEQLRVQGIMNAAHSYNKAAVGWRRKLAEYQDAWTEYIKLQINLELCAKLKNLIPILDKHMDAMYRNYFSPLADMLDELGKTFDANIAWLNSPEHEKNESFSWRIFQYDAVKEQLDSTVLKQQNMELEHQDFMSYLLAHYKEWNTRSPYNIAHCVNDYMTERFRASLNRTVDDFLMTAYGVNNEAMLPEMIRTRLLNAVSEKASPMFWKSNTFLMDNTTTVSNNVLSIPTGSTAIANAASAFANENTNIIIRPSTLGDRISCLRFVSGIPFYAYQGIEKLKGPYEASTDPGLHLHEKDVNWRSTLPSPIPYSISVINRDAKDEDNEKAALYDLAVKERVICPRSAEYADTFVVRKLPNTEELVAPYQKGKYYFAGRLNLGELERDIEELKIKREGLLPETVPEHESVVLLNDGYRDVDNPAMDARETVRRDYFVRFNSIRKAAEDSLAQLKRIDDKIAEMESWKGGQQEEQKKIKRYLMLEEMGYLQKESPVKIKLRYTYRGIPTNTQVCDVNSPYRFAPEYQVYLALDTLDHNQLQALDEELAKKYLNPLASWRAPLKRIINEFTDEKIEEIGNRYINDANHDAIPAFYHSLRDIAAEELMIIPDDEPVFEPIPVPKPAQKTWTCSCGTVNNDDEMFCGECGKPKPVSTPETWTCANGHVVPWAKKFCPKCGLAGGKRPDPEAFAAPQKWVCKACGAVNEPDDPFCGECGGPKG